jgi:SAM-dependent methyltransferase
MGSPKRVLTEMDCCRMAPAVAVCEKPTSGERHSEAYLGRQRDHWWNEDFLALMARRWQLGSARKVLDVGCGTGHWTQLLTHRLPPQAKVVGLDRSATWVKSARTRLSHEGVARADFCVGDAVELPFASDTFDVVTSQTVLMHLAEPQRALREMVRVLRSHGLLVCMEPNNVINGLRYDSLFDERGIDDVTDEFNFLLRYRAGRRSLGLGDIAVGEFVPGWLAELGLDVTIHLNDKSGSLLRPYVTAAEKSLFEQTELWWETSTGPWEIDNVTKCAMAGDADDSSVQRHFQRLKVQRERLKATVESGKYCNAGGAFFYIVSGRKT